MSKTKSKKFTSQINKSGILYLCFFLTLSTLTFFNFALYFTDKPKVIFAESENYAEKIAFWKEFLINNPEYQDGWVELSRLEAKAGNRNEAEFAYQKATEINPNNSELISLEQEISLILE